MENSELVRLAKIAMENAYVPYSKFRVGAALLTDKDEIYTGCNIENAAYGSTNCAERTAIFKAVSEGKRNFKRIAIISDSDHLTYPCGICRQVLAEFSTNIEVVVANNKGEYKIHKFSDILPYAFTNDDLERSNVNE